MSVIFNFPHLRRDRRHWPTALRSGLSGWRKNETLQLQVSQVVYKFNLTNFQEIPGGISRKIQDMFALLRPAVQCTESTSLPKYRTKTWYAQHGAVAKIKRATSFWNMRSGTQFHHDWKLMQSIIDILHKNFQEDHSLHCILMTVMIVGGEVFANIGLLIVVYFCIVFVLLYF